MTDLSPEEEVVATAPEAASSERRTLLKERTAAALGLESTNPGRRTLLKARRARLRAVANARLATQLRYEVDHAK